ncbi:hypothetical protein KUTeg_003526 [Tegillarca granosa]|uniref:Uncharacterized protein n=1 Tax=Tegillarca granosa TaxID=220873 RepID=A0ABQ9FRT3_TEGGR|nr:hypothetical protein KUTeg_003526 [Tegillarca granosa]
MRRLDVFINVFSGDIALADEDLKSKWLKQSLKNKKPKGMDLYGMQVEDPRALSLDTKLNAPSHIENVDRNNDQNSNIRKNKIAKKHKNKKLKKDKRKKNKADKRMKCPKGKSIPYSDWLIRNIGSKDQRLGQVYLSNEEFSW